MASVVFLHPIGLDANCWQWVDFARSAVRHEFPGHGSRPALGTDFSLSELADDLDGRLTDEPADIIGISLGGAVALHLALRHPAKVRSLVLACTTAVEDEAVLTRRADAELRSPEAAETTLRRWFTVEALNVNGPPVAYARNRLMTNDRFAVAAAWRALARHDVMDQLGSVKVPTTLVAGLRDQSVRLSEVEQIYVRLQTSRLVTIDGPHMLMLENPAEFTEAIAGHLHWIASSQITSYGGGDEGKSSQS